MDRRFYQKYSSATHAACGTQTLFRSEGDPRTGRVYNKLYVEGTFEFSLLYSNITDSTFGDGANTVRNMPGEPWRILGASLFVSRSSDPNEDNVSRVVLRFGGESVKDVAPGEIFTTDPVSLTVKKGDYLGVEMTYSGSLLPCHRESIVPIFRKTPEGWIPDPYFPVPSMTGCSRAVSARVCFWGDSITQGIGTPNDSYSHYAARTAEIIGSEKIAYWNIGLGWARADDAATGGVWMERALNNDIVSVCFGVNDLYNGFHGEEVINNLTKIVSSLRKSGCSVLVQTLPPFGDDLEFERNRQLVNRLILNNTELGADAVFDCGAILGNPSAPHLAQYGDHPNSEGCGLWAEALAPVLKKLISSRIGSL